MMISYYRNKRNPNKFLEIHNDGHYHNTVRQFMYWQCRKWNVLLSECKNYTGDGHLRRWRIRDLKELLADYEKVEGYRR